MIQESNQEAEQYLTSEELRYPIEEQQVLRALRYLKDRGGLSRMDKDFVNDLTIREKPWTAKQLLVCFRVARKYQRTQLARAGFLLPEEEAVQTLAKRKEMGYAARQQQYSAPVNHDTGSSARLIGIREGNLGIMFPNNSPDFKTNIAKIRQLEREVKGLRLLRPDLCEVKFVEAPGKSGSTMRYYQAPLELIEQVCKAFPDLRRMPDVQGILDEQLRRAQEEHHRKQESYRLHKERTDRLLGALESIDTIGDRTLYQHQKDAIYQLIDWGSGILAHDPGLGKAQPLTAKILTPQGWKLMGDIQVGDEVINSQGTISHVTGVHPQGMKEIHEVTFYDESSTECCDEHLWAVRTHARVRRGMPARILPLKEIASDLYDASGHAKHYIPMVKAVQFPKQDLPLDPYVLGALLGNGGMGEGSIVISTPDQEMLDTLLPLMPQGLRLVPTTNPYDWRISARGGGKPNPVMEALRELDLYGHICYTKFIPERYKLSSIDQRISLLQGLLDTDGCVRKSDNNIEFASSSKQLALDVIEIVRSLGGRATLRSRIPKYTYKGEKLEGAIAYRMSVCLPPDIAPFRLSRKANIYHPREKYQPSRGIRSVEYVGKKLAQCITVDAADHLYVTDDYIVTHNSLSASMIAKAWMKSEQCRVIVVGPKTLRANWVREAGWCEVPIEYFTHDSIPADIPGKFVLIVDECHAYQNKGSKRSKKFLELAWKAEAVIAATGTPSKNGRPSNIYPLLLACKHPLVYSELSDGTPAEDQIKKLRTNFEKRYCAAVSTEYSEWDVTGAAFLEELHKKIVDSPRGVLRKRKDQCLDLPAKIRKLAPVDLTAEEAAVYRKEVSGMWEEYTARVQEKIDDFVENTLPGKIEKELERWVRKCLIAEGNVLDPKSSALEVATEEEIETFKNDLTAELIVQETQRVESGQALVVLGHLRHAGSRAKARAKARAAIDQIKEIFEEDRVAAEEAARENRSHKSAAVVVFCSYKDTAQQIADAFEVPVMSGDTPDKKRQPLVDDFQAGKTRVFVGVYGAGGVGITLTAAAHIILVDRAWTPGDIEQAEGRIERIGQDRTMISMWLQIPQFINPVDVKIDSILQQKQENIVKMLDGGLENYKEDQLFRNIANDLLWDATHFIAGKESEE